MNEDRRSGEVWLTSFVFLFRINLEGDLLEGLSTLLQRQEYRGLVDFDNHLDNISLDWQNNDLNEIIDETMEAVAIGWYLRLFPSPRSRWIHNWYTLKYYIYLLKEKRKLYSHSIFHSKHQRRLFFSPFISSVPYKSPDFFLPNKQSYKQGLGLRSSILEGINLFYEKKYPSIN